MSEESTLGMSQSQSHHALPHGEVERRDPLGEIRHYAKQLWKEAGSHSDSSWQDHFAEAENLLMRGRSDPSKRNPVTVAVKRRIGALEPLSEDFATLVQDADDEFLSILASAYRNPLTEHECACLYSLLSTHLVDLPGWKTVGPLGIEEVAELLSHLAAEYPAQIFQGSGIKKGSDLPLATRKYHWEKFLKQKVYADEALSFHDRNTMARLKFRLEEEPRVLAVSHVDISRES